MVLVGYKRAWLQCSSRLNGGGFVNIFIGQMPRKKFNHIQQIVQIDYNSLNWPLAY